MIPWIKKVVEIIKEKYNIKYEIKSEDCSHTIIELNSCLQSKSDSFLFVRKYLIYVVDNQEFNIDLDKLNETCLKYSHQYGFVRGYLIVNKDIEQKISEILLKNNFLSLFILNNDNTEPTAESVDNLIQLLVGDVYLKQVISECDIENVEYVQFTTTKELINMINSAILSFIVSESHLIKDIPSFSEQMFEETSGESGYISSSYAYSIIGKNGEIDHPFPV